GPTPGPGPDARSGPDRPRAGAHVLGVPAAGRAGGPRGPGSVLAQDVARPLRPGRPGAERIAARSGCGQADLDPPGDLRPDRPAPDARGDRRLPRRCPTRCVRPGRRSLARLAAVRRTVGTALAGRGPLRRLQRPG